MRNKKIIFLQTILNQNFKNTLFILTFHYVNRPNIIFMKEQFQSFSKEIIKMRFFNTNKG